MMRCQLATVAEAYSKMCDCHHTASQIGIAILQTESGAMGA